MNHILLTAHPELVEGRRTRKFFSIALMLSMVTSSAVYAQSVQEWDKQYFASLDDTDKKVVISIVRSVGELFDQCAKAIDKGGEALINSYAGLMMFYQQGSQAVAPRIDSYQKRMPVINAINIVPNIEDIEKIVQNILPEQPKNERAVKRAINKALRNKKTKQQLKVLLTEKNNHIKNYVQYIENNYADLIKELNDFAEQMQDMLKNIEE